MRASRVFASVTAIAAITGGALLTVPTAAVGQEAPNSGQSATLKCNVDRDSAHVLSADCWRGDKKRGYLEWRGDSYTGENGFEFLVARDKLADAGPTTVHLGWYHGGKRHHRSVTDPQGGPGTSILPSVPEGAKVSLKLCVANVGCGPTYSSRA